MKRPENILFFDYPLLNGVTQQSVCLSYELFGRPLHSAPVVLVNHALTGNSTVTGPEGWWKSLIGKGQVIDTEKYTIIAFNIPGNGYKDSSNVIDNYKDFTVYDIARIFWSGLNRLEVENLYAVIGGSLGGALAWEMAVHEPGKIQHLVPVATNFKSTDWLIANVLVQDLILNNSYDPLHDARIHAMLLYRTPESFRMKFNRQFQNDKKNLFQVESWLFHHGDKLRERLHLKTYKLMNHLLKTIDISQGKENYNQLISDIRSDIYIIDIDSDCFFTTAENIESYHELKAVKKNIYYNKIQSIHGHDAFLIEYAQLNEILKPVFE